jgi:hypothetical protein
MTSSDILHDDVIALLHLPTKPWEIQQISQVYTKQKTQAGR